MRVNLGLMVLLVSGCGRAISNDVPDAATSPRCSGPVPGFAETTQTGIVARCGDVEVQVSPLDGGVIKLRYAVAGAPVRPSWAVGPTTPDFTATLGGSDGSAVVCTSAMTVEVDDRCRVRATLSDGTVVVDDAEPFAVGTDARLVRTATADRVYGLGERTGGLDKRGRAWTFWNTDAYDATLGGWKPGQDPLYQSIPFEVRMTGPVAYGLFTDETRRMVIDLGAADPTRDEISAVGARSLEQYLIAGPRMANVVERYTALTGRPMLPPRWALGFHQSRWGYPDATTIEAIADRFRAENIPADALWLDIQHHRGMRPFTIDDTAFPPTMIPRLTAKGFRVIAIADPGIKVEPGWDVFDSGLAGGHFLTHGDGSLYQGAAWPGASAFPDVSRAATRTWWGAQITRVAERGIAGIWLDVNEPTTFPEGGSGTSVPDELVVDGDGTPATMAELHNAYALFQARATFDALAARGTRPFVLSRAGYAGIQRYAAVWTGDVPSTWTGLEQTLPMLLGLGISGVPIVGSDIGGYSGHATPELYARWMALGSISPFARAHVTSGVPGQEPWMFGAEVTEVSRARLADRYRLLPYLYSLADQATRTGAPILRPLVWEFPDDPQVATLDDQAMLGPFILVAPIVKAGATTRSVYLPAGRWFELHSGAIFEGPTTIEVAAPLAALPMYVREGAILPTTDGIDVYPGAVASSFSLYEDDGEQLTGGTRTTFELAATSEGATLTLARTGLAPARTLTVRVHRVDGAVTAVDGALTFTHDANTRTLSATVVDAPAVSLAFHYDRQISDPRPPVAITFEVRAPADTPMATPIHIAASATQWQHVAIPWVAPGVARGTVMVPRGDWFDYKFTRGSWLTVEKLAGCTEAPDRYRFGAGSTVVDSVGTWRDRCE